MSKLSDLFLAHGITEYGSACESIECLYWPMPHQSNTLKKYASSNGFLDASDPGTGKTLPAQLNAIRLASLKHKVLFCMPPKLLPQFEKEFNDVFPNLGEFLVVDNLNCNSNKKKQKIDVWDKEGWPNILLMSYDVYRMLNDNSSKKKIGENLWKLEDGSPYFKEKGVPHIKGAQAYTSDGRLISKSGRADNKNKFKLASVGYDVVFCDEAHALCGTESLLSQSAYDMQKKGCKLYLMTGTPIPTHLEDIYGILRLINPTAYRDKWQFLRRHTVTRPLSITRSGKSTTIQQIIGYLDTEEIFTKLYSNAVRVQKRDILTELADPLVSQVIVNLEPSHRSLYRSLVNEQFALLGQNVLNPDNESALRHLALQIISCPERFGYEGKNSLSDTCSELISTINPENNKVIIFAYYKNTIELLATKYKELNPALIYGETSDSFSEVSRFISDNSCRIAIVNWKSGGAGLNLQVASHIIFYECPTSPGDVKQAIARCDRKGQKNVVNVYFMRVKGTLLDKNFKSLLLNESNANKVLKDKKDLLSDYFAV